MFILLGDNFFRGSIQSYPIPRSPNGSAGRCRVKTKSEANASDFHV